LLLCNMSDMLGREISEALSKAGGFENTLSNHLRFKAQVDQFNGNDEIDEIREQTHKLLGLEF